MPLAVKTPDDLSTEFDLDDDRFHHGCDWGQSPCGQFPEYHLSYRCPIPEHTNHGTEVELYCARHYALTLLRIQEVDLVLDPMPFWDYIWDCGRIDSDAAV